MRRVVASLPAGAVFLSGCTGLSVRCGDVKSAYAMGASSVAEHLQTAKQHDEEGDLAGWALSRGAASFHLEYMALLVRDNKRCFDAAERAWAEQVLRARDREASN